MGQGGHGEQEPHPQAAVEVESDDTGDGEYDCRFPQNIDITHCGEYYVYFLPETPSCMARYCAAFTS